MDLLSHKLNKSRNNYFLVRRGAFSGLAVLVVCTDFPILVTTTKTRDCVFLELRGKKEANLLILK